jgi:hypothetical protein
MNLTVSITNYTDLTPFLLLSLPRSAEERPARKGADRAAETATKVADAQSKWIYLGYGAALGGLLNMCAWLLWSYMSR